MSTAEAPTREQGMPGWLVVVEQELRDLWFGGRGLLLCVAFSGLLSVIAYLVATNTALNFLEQRESVNLTLQVAVAVGAITRSRNRQRSGQHGGGPDVRERDSRETGGVVRSDGLRAATRGHPGYQRTGSVHRRSIAGAPPSDKRPAGTSRRVDAV